MKKIYHKIFNENLVGNDYVVGDIHGRFSKLESQLNKMGFNREKDRLFSVGDLIDRGKESHLVLDWLDYNWFFPVIGNHEEMILMNDHDIYASTHLHNGGLWFYTLLESEQAEIKNKLKKLPFAISVKTKNGLVGIVHAEYPSNDWEYIEDIIDNQDTRDYLLWGRERVNERVCDLVRNITKIYCGHTFVESSMLLGNHLFIDNGAWFNDKDFIIELI